MKDLCQTIELDYTPILLSHSELRMITDALVSAICIDDTQAAALVRRLVAEFRKPCRQIPTIEEIALGLAS